MDSLVCFRRQRGRSSSTTDGVTEMDCMVSSQMKSEEKKLENFENRDLNLNLKTPISMVEEQDMGRIMRIRETEHEQGRNPHWGDDHDDRGSREIRGEGETRVDEAHEEEEEEEKDSNCQENNGGVDTKVQTGGREHGDRPETKEQGSFEPPWAGSVGKTGELFYVEPGEPGDESGHINGSNHVHTALKQNGFHLNHHNEHTASEKKGIKKKVKGLLTKKNDTKEPNVLKNHLNNNSAHSVTFNDAPSGVLKEVCLIVDPNRHNYGRRATFCETLFGIVPGYFNSRFGEVNGPSQDKRIMVQGLLPGGEALKSGEVKIGDWLMCVNDLEVNFNNVDNILAAVTGPKEVKLTLQKLAIQPTPRPILVKKNNVVNERLVKLVSGERLHLEDCPSMENHQHVVLYLTLEGNSEAMRGKEDVHYQFPRKDGKLVEIRGLFITLSHMLLDVTNNTSRNSTLLVDGQLVHVGYSKEQREVMVIAVPAEKVAMMQLNHVVDDVVRMMKVLYGSLHHAFSIEENHGRLDHFFSLLFQRVVLSEELLRHGVRRTQFIEPLCDVLPGVRILTLPEEVKVTVNNCLSELEAADFADMSDEYYDMRRSYCILGSCLFYKGYLTASHLHKEDLVDISLYLQYYCLLTLCNEEQMGQMVVWKEVYPWRRCHVQVDPLIPGYTEPEARWFFLVVGMKNSMLGLLLEAGGCASWAEGHPTPDPFYVDQVKATLLQLESLDVPTQCETRLVAPSIPSLACVDWFFPSSKGNKEEVGPSSSQLHKVQGSPKAAVSPSKKLLQPESILKKKTTSPQADRQRGRGVMYEVESDADSHSTGNSEASTPIMDRRGRKASAGSDESIGSGGSSSLFKGNKKKRTMLSAYDVSGLRRTLGEATGEDGSFVKLTSGCDNTLFHYVEMNSVEGIYLCPSQQELNQVYTATHSQVLRNFHQACLAIRSVFQHSSKAQEGNKNIGRFGVDSSLGKVTEHGMLFQCTPEKWNDPKKPPPTVTYWVVGRIFQEPCQREFFVCFQDSAQQNLVELAFKLGFGLAL